MKPIRILLADDHTLVRAGIRSLLNNIAGIEVIAEASDGREALRLVRAHSPDVVLMDIAMPGLNGLEASVRISKEFPLVRVIILSMHLNEEYILQALRAGAKGYILKGADTAELEIAIRTVARGETYLSPIVSKHVVADYIQCIGGATKSVELLTARQREVLQLISEGYSTKGIARTLGISVKTVETHRIQLMERLDIHDIAGLVRYAIRVGLVEPDQ
ncbi:MAG TPA: response regulator transcription factor [Thermodesulfobacteriota bacterium]